MTGINEKGLITRWSIVYDLGKGEVFFRTDGNRAIRRLAVANFDLSCGTPVKMLDVAAGSAGDVSAAFVDYSPAANRALVEASFTKTPFLREVQAAAREAFAAHPGATSSCAAPSRASTSAARGHRHLRRAPAPV